MIAKFFGQYLLEKGVITGDQLLQAVEYQKSLHHKFGSYALRFNYLTLNQINELHREQLKDRRAEKIGELAVEKGYLAREQVDEIIMRQKNDHLLLGEAIVRLGFMEREKLYLYLDEYHRMTMAEDMHISMEHFPEEPLLLKLCELFIGLLQRMADIKVKPQVPVRKAQVRCPDPVALARLGSRRKPIRVLLTAPPGPTRQITARYFGDDAAPTPELMKSAMEEFLNVLCGNFVGVAAQMGKSWELEAPLTHPAGEEIIPLYGDCLVLVPFSTPDETIHLFFDVGGRNAAEAKKETVR
jgi:hypothetical protein